MKRLNLKKASYSDMEKALMDLLNNHRPVYTHKYEQDTEDLNMVSYENLKSKLISMSYEEFDEMFSYPEEDWKYYIPITEDIFGCDKCQWELIYKAKRIWEEGYSVSEMISSDADWENLDTAEDFNNKKFELAEKEWLEENDDTEEIKTDCIKDAIADIIKYMNENKYVCDADRQWLEKNRQHMTAAQIMEYDTFLNDEFTNKTKTKAAKCSAASKKVDRSYKKKPVRDKTSNVVYDSIGEAAKILNTTPQTISRWIKSGKFEKI